MFCYSCVETPDIPHSVAPYGGISLEENNSITISWAPISSASSYRLQVCAEENFENCVFDQSGITETSYKVPNLAYGTFYYCRVAAHNKQKESPWSDSWNFCTLPSVPLLTSPTDGTTDQCTNSLLTWEPSQGCNEYELYLSMTSDFGEFSAVSENSYELKDLHRLTTYYWQVAARGECGKVYSEISTFTTDEGQCPGIPTVTYEGKVYNTVQMGDQCWLRENLDVGVQINSSQYSRNNKIIEKYYFNDDPDYGAIYGGLYQWFEAMKYIYVEGSQGICPAGWHIPTLEELEALRFYNHTTNALLAVGQGDGNNLTGFSLLISGSYAGEGQFHDYPPMNLWSSTEGNDPLNAITLFVNDVGAGIGNYSKELGFPVRCIKDK